MKSLVCILLAVLMSLVVLSGCNSSTKNDVGLNSTEGTSNVEDKTVNNDPHSIKEQNLDVINVAEGKKDNDEEDSVAGEKSSQGNNNSTSNDLTTEKKENGEVSDIGDITYSEKKTLTSEQDLSLTKLFNEAGSSSILVGTNGNKLKLDEAYSAKLFKSLDKFTVTKEGHLYDGLVDAYVIYSDGTVLGVYSSPAQSVPDRYASCEGLVYGVIYKVDEKNSVISSVYGFFPIEASSLPLQDIGY